MDAAPLTAERRRELAELRSRAYGPDADIDRDADALARLIELEELARADAPADDGDRERMHPDAAVVADAGAPATAVLREDAAPGDATRGGDVPSADARSRRRWRRVPVWGYVAGAAAIGLGIGLTVPALTPPHPIAELRPAPFIDGVELDFRMYGIPAESPVRYEPFRGLEVWSAETEEGSTCVVVTTGDGEWMTAGCAPGPLTPTADITFYQGMRQIDGLDLADGSVIRFLLRGEAMEVWIAETDEVA
jgi:hypothetical protein